MNTRKWTIALHGLLLLLEGIALVNDIQTFGWGMFRFYTINSNLLQLFVSAAVLWLLLRQKRDRLPGWLKVCHLIAAVCLTVTFLIAAAVLAPQEGFRYYFLQDVAPVNHFLGPVLSVLSFIWLSGKERLPRPALAAPTLATLLYGLTALILNAAGALDGPYFFLRARSVAAGTIVLWFGIVALLCLGLSALYLRLRRRGA